MKCFLLIILSFSLVSANAQTAKDSVMQTINNLFDAMRSSKVELLSTCFTDSAIMQTIAVNKEGKVQVKTASVQGFINSIATLPANAADERIVFEMVKIDGNLASAWTPYSFYFNGKLSHCGVNSFQLVRIDGVWKIHYIIDTRRKTSCADM